MAVANYLHSTGRLPPCYLTRRQAEAKGWRPGANLWGVAPGSAIGGDRFGNREHRLPPPTTAAIARPTSTMRAVRGGPSGSFMSNNGQGTWRQWVTVNHYRHFYELPEAE